MKYNIIQKQITIRHYKEADFVRLCQIHDAARKKELALSGLSDAFLPLTVAAEREGLFDYDIYVAETDEKNVEGFVAFSDDEIAWLYVDVNCFRQGIGKKMLQYALEHTNKSVSIEVLKGNTPAVSLYLSFGFAIQKTLSGKMPGNEDFSVTVHVMQKPNT